MKVSRAQAIALAERYVRNLGLAHDRRLELEVVDSFMRVMSCLKDAPWKLEARAWSASRTSAGWSVVFRHLSHRPQYGQVVTMDRFGRKIDFKPL
jgi:hypothetical protein